MDMVRTAATVKKYMGETMSAHLTGSLTSQNTEFSDQVDDGSKPSSDTRGYGYL